MAEEVDIQEPPVEEQQTPEQGPGPKPVLKDTDKQKLVQIITKMQAAGEPEENIKAVAKRFHESVLAQPTNPVDQKIDKTTDKVNQEIQYNGTFKPDLEGEKKGIYTNDPDYQKQKADFVKKIYTDTKGNLSYPEQDAKGNWVNYYTKEPIVNFDPHEMRGKILQVPHEYLPATGGKKFITPVYNQKTGAYEFPDVQTPDVPHEQTLPEATVYGSKNAKNNDYGFISYKDAADFETPDAYLRDLEKKGIVKIDCP